MHWLDWLFIALPLLIVAGIGIYAQRYMRSVADFMSGNRLAGRYLLAVAGGEMQAGAVVFVASFEVLSNSGFTQIWWGWLTAPIPLIFGIAGFVGFRFRETRAMTWAQFFEIRYSRRFRLFMGGLGFAAGITNFGIIPAVGARFFVYFLEMPESVHMLGWTLPTYIPVMAVLLSITTILAISGGLITVMVTDCVEGILSQLFYLVIIVALLMIFRWSDISATLAAAPAGQSRLNPFDSMGLKDFNLWTVLMAMIVNIYGSGAWQNASAYKSASLSPHEGRMGGLLGQWRELGKAAVVAILGVCAITFLHHPHYAAQAGPALGTIRHISTVQIQRQMEVPVALSYLLPVGIKGMFCAILLLGVFGGDGTHLHSWGGILVQDVFVPLRKQPFTPRQHIRMLRLAMIGVAFFAFLFGALFRQTEFIFMWWGVTQALYVGGAGAAIIGGLYWKKGTVAGAWVAMLTGSTLATAGILARQFSHGTFPLNGAQISFGATMIAGTAYVVMSLLTCKADFNMDRMLHRGPYASVKALVGERVLVPAPRHQPVWGRLIGLDSEYTPGDKWIAGGLFAWSALCMGMAIIGTVWNLVSPWPPGVWSVFWHVVGIGIPVIFTVVTGLWFTWGGVRDIRTLFRRLRLSAVNNLDDGSVLGHLNLDEATVAGEAVIVDDQPEPDELSAV